MPDDPSNLRELLRFDAVTLPSELCRTPLDFTLHCSELALVRMPNLERAAVFADLVCGVRAPHAGAVRFLRRDWRHTSRRDVDRARGAIGRLFARGGWIDHLRVVDNMLLAPAYHSNRPLRDLLSEINARCQAFGLPGVPLDQAETLAPGDLQRAACARAFVAEPRLIVLEGPLRQIFPDALAPLMNAIRQAQQRGAGVLWLTTSREVWNAPLIHADQRLRLAGDVWRRPPHAARRTPAPDPDPGPARADAATSSGSQPPPARARPAPANESRAASQASTADRVEPDPRLDPRPGSSPEVL